MKTKNEWEYTYREIGIKMTQKYRVKWEKHSHTCCNSEIVKYMGYYNLYVWSIAFCWHLAKKYSFICLDIRFGLVYSREYFLFFLFVTVILLLFLTSCESSVYFAVDYFSVCYTNTKPYNTIHSWSIRLENAIMHSTYRIKKKKQRILYSHFQSFSELLPL